MRILRLTPRVQQSLLQSRRRRDHAAERIAARIVGDVRRRGDDAVFAWARKLDGLKLSHENLWVSRNELRAAARCVAPEFVRAVKHAARNVKRVAERQLPRAWDIAVEPGIRVGQIVRPISSIGCYIPGGRHALLSTLVMTVVPARVAGVERVVVVCPRPSPELLATAAILGIEEIARIGGAQAVGALAYGTANVPRVEKIFGPGNRFVTAAKLLVSGDCAIDLPAGPTEAIVLATTGNAAWIAADMLSQAEHAPDAASFLVTTSKTLAKSVQREIETQLRALPLTSPAWQSTRTAGAILLAPSLAAACDFVNRFAPEHLSLPRDSNRLLKECRSAGTVFLGPWAAQPLGDYATGSNHVLPTAGWARRRGGLSAADFVKCVSVQSISRQGFSRLAADVKLLARAEGLPAHANALEVRG